ncbi:MAG: TonB-dependent receptor [Candidatus Omnitrophica bacterium]|nr:TonB-dependent receptor [Candidatus Omnitrophota bacterium]
MKKLTYVLAVCAFLAKSVLAEENSKVAEKPSLVGQTIDTTLSPLDSFFSQAQRLDPIVITPTRYEDPSLNVSSNITVITEDEIKRSCVKYIPDLLRQQAGIVVNDLLGNGKSTSVDIRGFGDSAAMNVLVLVDGRRTNQIDLSGVDWTQIDINNVEKIEIVRGGQSVLYGDNATGGVVNIITKSGKDKKYEAGVRLASGSDRYKACKAHIAGSNSFLDYYANLSSTYNHGRRVNNNLETADYAANITLRPTDSLKLNFSTAYHKDWYGLPSAVKPSDINLIGREGSLSPDNRAKTEDAYFMFTPEADLNTALGELFFSSDVVLKGRRSNAVFKSSSGDSIVKHHITGFGVTPKLAFTKELFNVENRLMVGLDYYANRDFIEDGFESQIPFIFPTTINYIKIHKDTLGVYISDTAQLPLNFILTSGVRGEGAFYYFDQDAVVRSTNRAHPLEYAYDIGLTYKYNKNSSIYGRYSRSFRFPATDEYYSPIMLFYTFTGDQLVSGGLDKDLKTQTAYNYELGIKENSSKYLSLKADCYFMDVRNELMYDPIEFKNTTADFTIHYGLELEGHVYLFDMLDIFANYTYQKAYFTENGSFVGNEIPLVPHNRFSAGVNLSYMDCFYMSYITTYVGERYFANDLLNEMPKMKPHMVHDVKFSYKKYGVELFLSINNILDEEYEEYGALDFYRTSPGYYPCPRRNYILGLEYKF